MEELKGQRQALQEDADRKLRQVMREMDAQQRCALQVCACVRVCMHAYTHAYTYAGQQQFQDHLSLQGGDEFLG